MTHTNPPLFDLLREADLREGDTTGRCVSRRPRRVVRVLTADDEGNVWEEAP